MEPAALTVPERKTLSFSLLFLCYTQVPGKVWTTNQNLSKQVTPDYFIKHYNILPTFLVSLRDFKLSVLLFHDFS